MILGCMCLGSSQYQAAAQAAEYARLHGAIVYEDSYTGLYNKEILGPLHTQPLIGLQKNKVEKEP